MRFDLPTPIESLQKDAPMTPIPNSKLTIVQQQALMPAVEMFNLNNYE